MKHKKLKPILTGSVFLLPAFLFFNGQTQKSNAMIRGAISRLPALNKINMPTLNKPTFNTKLNQIKLPNTFNKVNVSTTKPTLSFNRTYSLKTGKTLKFPTISKSHSFGGRLSIPKFTPKNQVQNSSTPSEQPPKLQPRQPINNQETNFQKLDPGYNTVPKPIFTPRDPSKPLPEPEVYENVVILNTNAGTLTIFKN